MTLVSDIITAAYRESNLIPLVSTPNTNQQTEALNRLNPLLMSTIGNEVGDGFTDVNIGGDYDQSELISTCIPLNTRLNVILTAADTFLLHPKPQDGQRVAVIGDFDTYNLIIDGNGRNIESAATVTLSAANTVSQWLYRADTGNWFLIEVLEAADTWPLPLEFDDFFITMLALRINPRYGQAVVPETLEYMKRMRSQLRARYRVTKQILPDLDTREFLSNAGRAWSGYNDIDDFDSGRLGPWL